MVTLQLIFFVVFILKFLAIIFVCGLISGLVPGVGAFLKGLTSFLFHEGEKISAALMKKIKGGKG